jgi:hypothetical protein
MSSADFILLPPIAVTDAILTSTNVPETLVTVYAGGTTYNLSDLAGVSVGTVQSVYKSLQAANTGHTPASSPTWWEFLGVVYAPYNVGTTYAANDIVSSISADVHLLYKSVAGSNLGNALTDVTKWVSLGSTNARAMFDATYGSQTTNADSISFVVSPAQLINGLFLGNLAAASVVITQSISGFTTTIPLSSHAVNNWYDWYYVPLISVKDLAVVGSIPPYPTSTFTVTINNIGGIAACGLFVMGVGRIIGQTQWGVMAGILSYSGTTTDAFGNTTFVKRAQAKRLNVNVRITHGFEDEAFRLLTLCTDIPIVVIATTDYQIGVVYCYLGNWQVPISITGQTAPIELKGLT